MEVDEGSEMERDENDEFRVRQGGQLLKHQKFGHEHTQELLPKQEKKGLVGIYLSFVFPIL